MNKTEIFDKFAPIIPAEGLGGVTIRSHIKEIHSFIEDIVYSSDGNSVLESPFYVRYEIKDMLSVVIDILTGTIVKVGALSKYKGKLLSTIEMGMTVNELMILEPRIYYDDFEELLLIEGVSGVSIETDTPELNPIENREQTIVAITVYTPDFDNV